MAWTTPRTWVASETLTAALLNTHVRDNLNHLYGSYSSQTIAGSWQFASGTITLNASNSEIRYQQVGKRVHAYGHVELSSYTGSGSLQYVLPVTARTGTYAYYRIGTGNGYNNSSGAWNAWLAYLGSTTVAQFIISNAETLNVQAHNNGPWAADSPASPDSWQFEITYEAA